MQTLLFDSPPHLPKFPEGFLYFPEYISVDEEQSLLNYISGIELHTFQFHGYEAKRKVASFGFDYSFDQRALEQGKPIPTFFDSLIERVANTLSLSPANFAELLVTEYPVGSVINWHRDAQPFELIAGISLNADCTFPARVVSSIVICSLLLR